MSAECDRRVAIAERFLQSFRTRRKRCTLTRGQADELDLELPKNGDLPKSPLSPIGSLMPSAGTFQFATLVRITSAMGVGIRCQHFREATA
jgi:hypothetical protein